jgi:uncharacterized protein YecE (DUF72 family)
LGTRIGTAGWAIPKASAERFPTDGSALERYSRVLTCAEINSTFYRSHRASTYARWAQSVPRDFAFSVKMPKSITHERKLADCTTLIKDFLDETDALGEKRGALLVQLPPKLAYDEAVARKFFETVRSLYAGHVALEPRHADWFSDDVNAWLASLRIARVATDPSTIPSADAPGAYTKWQYVRLHGSPRRYYSAYGPQAIGAIANALRAAVEAWCIFDNTASGAATADALLLHDELRGRSSRSKRRPRE